MRISSGPLSRGIARLEVGEAPRRAPGRLGHRLLREEAGRGDHREAAVRELLLLHQAELSGVLGLEAEGIEVLRAKPPG